MDDYEQARALLSAIIAAYSARIGDSATSEEAERLRQTRASYVIERQNLTASDTQRVREINAQFGALLEAVRAGEQ